MRDQSTDSAQCTSSAIESADWGIRGVLWPRSINDVLPAVLVIFVFAFLQFGRGDRPRDMKKPPLTDHALQETLPPWGVAVLESHHSDDFAMDWRTHAFVKLVYVLRGRGVIEISQRVVHFHEGDLICVPPQTRNRITDSPDAASSLYVCCISANLFSFDATVLDALRPGVVSGGPHLSNRVASQLRRMRHEQSNQADSVSLSMVSGALRIIEWVIRQKSSSESSPDQGNVTQRAGRTDQEVMREYVQRLSTEFYEASTIDEAARSLKMSRRTFTKLFHEEAGTSWLSHVRKLAINHARHQLAQTNQSIVSVAFEAGFNDLSTFYRQFKSHTGMSPKAYRRSVR